MRGYEMKAKPQCSRRRRDWPCQPLSSRSSRITSGWRNAISISAFAGPEGLRRPCSHSCNVRGEIWSTSANSRCVRPVLPRASATSFGSTRLTRAALRAFISLTDCSSLLPSSSALRVSLLIFQYLTNRLQDVRGYVLLDGLLVDHQQPDLTICQLGKERIPFLLSPDPSGICFECRGFDDGKRRRLDGKTVPTILKNTGDVPALHRRLGRR